MGETNIMTVSVIPMNWLISLTNTPKADKAQLNPMMKSANGMATTGAQNTVQCGVAISSAYAISQTDRPMQK